MCEVLSNCFSFVWSTELSTHLIYCTDFLIYQQVLYFSKPVWKDGSTAVAVLAINSTLYIANLGDSKVSDKPSQLVSSSDK